MASRLRRIGVALLALLAVGEVAWLAGANWALSSGWLSRKINRNPERLLVEWSEPRTLLPGRITVAGLSVRGQTAKQQWFVAVRDAHIRMSLLALAQKTFRTNGVEARDLDVRSRRRRTDESESKDEAEYYPPISGLSVDDPPPPPREHRAKKPWRLSLANLRVDGVDQVWVLTHRLSGSGLVGADLEIQIRGETALQNLTVELDEARLFTRGESVASDAKLRVDGSLKPFRAKEVKGWNVMDLATGTIALGGEATGAALLNQLFHNFPVVKFGSSGGTLDGRFTFDEGQLQDGSHLELSAEDGWIDVLHWRSEAPLDLRFEVDRSNAETPSSLTATMTAASLAEPKAETALLFGADLTVRAEAERADLGGGVRGLAESFRALEVKLENSTMNDLGQLPVPELEGFSIHSGSLQVDNHTRFVRGGESTSVLQLAGTNIAVSYSGSPMTGDLDVELNLSSPDPESLRFDLADSFLKIDRVTIQDQTATAGAWYLHVGIPDGTVDLSERREVAATVNLRMLDSTPLVTIFGQTKGSVRRLKGLLKFKDLDGTAEIRMTDDTLQANPLHISSDGLQVRARLRIADKKPSGVLYTKFHGIPIAVDLRGEKRDLILIRPKRWYESQTVPWSDD